MGKSHGKCQTSHQDCLSGMSLLLSHRQQQQYQITDESIWIESQQQSELSIPSPLKICFTTKNPFIRYPIISLPLNVSNSQNIKFEDWLPPRQTLLAHRLLYHQFLFQNVLELLNWKDLQSLSQCNRRIKKEILIFKMGRKHNWDTTFDKISNYLQNGTYNRYAGIQELSEHSLDLDRSYGFLSSESSVGDRLEQQLKLDRVLRAFSFSIGYFQGLNAISAILLGWQNQERVYWIVRYLLHRAEDIQNNPEKYQKFIEDLDQRVQKSLPQIYKHLDKNGFSIDYFAMRWVLALFSYDADQQTLLTLWDLICSFGLSFVSVYIVSLLDYFKQKILKTHGNQLNDLLKHNFKHQMQDRSNERLLIFKAAKLRFLQEIMLPQITLHLGAPHEKMQGDL